MHVQNQQWCAYGVPTSRKGVGASESSHTPDQYTFGGGAAASLALFVPFMSISAECSDLATLSPSPAPCPPPASLPSWGDTGGCCLVKSRESNVMGVLPVHFNSRTTTYVRHGTYPQAQAQRQRSRHSNRQAACGEKARGTRMKQTCWTRTPPFWHRVHALVCNRRIKR